MPAITLTVRRPGHIPRDTTVPFDLVRHISTGEVDWCRTSIDAARIASEMLAREDIGSGAARRIAEGFARCIAMNRTRANNHGCMSLGGYALALRLTDE